MKFMKRILLLLLIFPFVYLLQLGARMFYQPTIVENEYGRYSKDLYQQLQFLKNDIHQGAGDDMQAIYPEGTVFLHVLYALSWANLVVETNDQKLREEALEEMRWSISRLESDSIKAIFPEDMFLPYGVFYQGWTNYTRARYLKLQAPENRDSIQQYRLQHSCKKIAAAIERHHTPFLFSYHYGCWPADNLVAMAALAEHDKLFTPAFIQTRGDWLTKMQTKLDTNGLIPHAVDLTYGNALIAARGSSQSLMLAFLPRIDTVFAQQQFKQYQNLFSDYRLGLPGIREYPHGTSGFGDIDAGPVIWDIGGAASVVGMGAMGQHESTQLYLGLRNSIEGFAIGTSWFGKKRYLFGQLPIADAFIAWSHSRVPLDVQMVRPPFFGKFLMLVLLVIGLFILLAGRIIKN